MFEINRERLVINGRLKSIYIDFSQWSDVNGISQSPRSQGDLNKVESLRSVVENVAL